MSTVFIVMGREFYASWPVRVCRSRDEAQAYADMLARRYNELRQPTDSDREQAAEYDTDVDLVAEQRAKQSIREASLDVNACGMDLCWDVVEVPELAATELASPKREDELTRATQVLDTLSAGNVHVGKQHDGWAIYLGSVVHKARTLAEAIVAAARLGS